MSKTKDNVGVNPTNIVANMSASILRAIVGSTFKVNPINVILSGVIAPNWKGNFTSGVSYMPHTETGDYVIWGWSPLTGFKSLGCIETCHMYNGNHDQDRCDAPNLSEVENVEDYIFFVVESGDNEMSERDTHFTIYKAPNFKEYFEKVTETDVQRWSNWIQA